MTKHTCIENRAIVEGWNLVVDANWIEEYRDFDPEALALFSTRKGSKVEFQTVEVTKVIEQEREYRFGYTGQFVDIVKSKTEKVLESKRMVLRQRKGRLTWVKV